MADFAGDGIDGLQPKTELGQTRYQLIQLEIFRNQFQSRANWGPVKQFRFAGCTAAIDEFDKRIVNQFIQHAGICLCLGLQQAVCLSGEQVK